MMLTVVLPTNLKELCSLLDELLTDSKDVNKAWLEHFIHNICKNAIAFLEYTAW